MKEHKIMNCLELRLENLVYNKHGEIHSIRPNDFYHWNQPKMDMDYGFYGILLTPEILEKVKWAGYGDLSLHRNFKIDSIGHLFYRGDYTGLNIHYLHQLQNLYFALTGEELNTEKINNYDRSKSSSR